MYSHTQATEYFTHHRSRIARIAKSLSLKNRNMASQTAMGWKQPSITREELVENYHRYRTLYDSPESLGEWDWARPYVQSMAELMRQISIT